MLNLIKEDQNFQEYDPEGLFVNPLDGDFEREILVEYEDYIEK